MRSLKPLSRISWLRHNLGVVVIAQILAAVIVISGHILLNLEMHGLQTKLANVSTVNSTIDDVQNNFIAIRTIEHQYVLTRKQTLVDDFYHSVGDYESSSTDLRRAVVNLPQLAPSAIAAIPLGDEWINLYGTPAVTTGSRQVSLTTQDLLNELSLTTRFNAAIAHANSLCDAEIIAITRTLDVYETLSLVSHIVYLTLTTAIISMLVLRYVKSRNKLYEYERAQLVEHLAASMAHEVRNPLQVTRGFMQLIKERVTDEQLKQYLSYAVSELDSAHHILSEYLALSKPDSDEDQLAPLKAIVADVLQLLTAYGNEYGCQIEFRSGDVAAAEFDSQKLKQVLLNIGKNAIEAMGHGGKLALSVESSVARVCVHMQDNGPGIPHEQLSKLGQPFFTTKATGTGIGLMIAYRLVEELCGKITVESTMGEGTVFHVCLPHKTDVAMSVPAPGSVAVSS